MLLKRKHPKSRRRRLLPLNGANGHATGKPYRPRRLPALTKPPKLTLFFVLLFAMLLGLSFAHIWKANAVSQVCIKLDTLRNRRQDLLERLKSQQLIFQDMTLYSKIEPRAREVLRMRPSTSKPVVIAPLQESLGGSHTAAVVRPSPKRD
jgi:hypothetical protein